MMHGRLRALLLGCLLVFQTACVTLTEAADMAVVGAWIHDGTGSEPLRADLSIRDGRIAAIGGRVRAVNVVEANGLHVVPGLIDMHVHVAAVEGRTVDGGEFLRHGVTTVRDLGGFRGQVLAAASAPDQPRIRSAIETLNGSKMAAFHRAVATAEEVRAAVDALATSGAAVIKIHRAFPPGLLAPLVAAAEAKGLGITGHIPLGLHPLRACELGITGVEHVGSFIEAYVSAVQGASQDDAIAYLLSPGSGPLYRCLAQRKVAVTPTLVLYESIARSRAPNGPLPKAFSDFIARLQAIVLRMHREGVTILAGSDASGLDRPAVAPGRSLLRELELLHEAGIDEREVMRAAAAEAGMHLGLGESKGSLLVPGLPADFLILPADPRDDISAYGRPLSIYRAGKPVKRKAGSSP
jgi:imidazolonepropionase-like amidohydrolase